MINQNMLGPVNYHQLYGGDVASNDPGCNNNFLFGLFFDKMVGLEQHVHLDGYDSTASAVISLALSDTLPTGAAARQETVTAAIQTTRYLVMANGQVEMIGF
jgi:hypothetical protein